MRNTKEHQSVTLEELLRLKRDEQPSSDFWDTFDNDFHRRRLHALVERDSARFSVWSPFLKAVMLGLPAVILVAFSVTWNQTGTVENLQKDQLSSSTPVLLSDPIDRKAVSLRPSSEWEDAQLTMTSGQLASQFVVDAIKDEPASTMNFRKVLYTPAIHLSAPTGASYVRDSLSSSNYQVTTADLKLGRNF